MSISFEELSLRTETVTATGEDVLQDILFKKDIVFIGPSAIVASLGATPAQWSDVCDIEVSVPGQTFEKLDQMRSYYNIDMREDTVVIETDKTNVIVHADVVPRSSISVYSLVYHASKGLLVTRGGENVKDFPNGDVPAPSIHDVPALFHSVVHMQYTVIGDIEAIRKDMDECRRINNLARIGFSYFQPE